MTADDGFRARRMTQAQEQALDALGRAFARLERVGLRVCGMDDNLIAYRADDLEALEADMELHEAQRLLNNTYETAAEINDHGVYRDSGGW